MSRDDRWIEELLEEKAAEIAELGRQAAHAFKDRGKTQLSNLEQAALHAETFAEVEAFIKRQVGLSDQSQRKPWKKFGPRLLEFLEELREKAMEIAKSRSGNQDAAMVALLEDRVPEKLYGTACRWLHSEYLYRLVEGTGGPGR